MKTIMLPKWVEQHAHEHAQNHAEHECGLSDANASDYQRAYRNAFKKFCLEYYEHSLIPAETEDSVKGNPYKHAATAAFRNFVPGQSLKKEVGEISEKHYFSDLFANSQIPKNELEKAIRRFTAAVNNLQDVFLDAKFGPVDAKNPLRVYDHQKKSKKGGKRGADKKVTGFAEVDSLRTQAGLTYRDVLINRYVRLFVTSMMLGTVRAAFISDAVDIDSTVRRILESVPQGDLNKKANTDAFATAVFEAIVKETRAPVAEIAKRGLETIKFKISDGEVPEQLSKGKAEARKAREELEFFPTQTVKPPEQIIEAPLSIEDLLESEPKTSMEDIAEQLDYEIEPQIPAPVTQLPVQTPAQAPETKKVMRGSTKKDLKSLLSSGALTRIGSLIAERKAKSVGVRDAAARLNGIIMADISTSWPLETVAKFTRQLGSYQSALSAAKSAVSETRKQATKKKLDEVTRKILAAATEKIARALKNDLK